MGDILLKPLIQFAGTDVSSWFDEKTGDVRYLVDPITNCKTPYVPFGRFVHIPPNYPTTDWCNNFGTPWWKNEKYQIGLLSKDVRLIKIINTLTLHEDTIEASAQTVALLLTNHQIRLYKIPAYISYFIVLRTMKPPL
ncbi:unnamed protein product [Protopolystoma xenopodis]|uniref:Uncharacterized protein n=1 Tax=Protopolystoma xenopodis TaxID=117903 RepID=A0A3S5B620_9PLAT|nr:unnamed protein product [Protopolystoma xenopodis]